MNTENNKIQVRETFLKGIEKIISKDQLRPILNGVYFHKGCAVATDSYQLVEIDLRMYHSEFCASAEGESAHKKNRDIEKIEFLDGYFLDQESLKEIKVAKGQFIEIETGSINIHKSNGKILKKIPLQPIDEVGVYPKYEQVIPTKTCEVEQINFNASYLLNVQTMYKNATFFPGLGIGLKMVFNGPKNGIRVTDNKGYFTGLVMPLALRDY